MEASTAFKLEQTNRQFAITCTDPRNNSENHSIIPKRDNLVFTIFTTVHRLAYETSRSASCFRNSNDNGLRRMDLSFIQINMISVMINIFVSQ